MNKLITKLLLLLFILTSFQAISQDKKGVALGNSANPARLNSGDLATYEAAALTGVQSTSLCTTVERAEWEKLLKERGIQETEDFLNGEIIPQGVSLGAEYLLLLSFQGNNVSKSTSRYKDKLTQKVELALTIGAKLVSVETGEVKHSKVINLKESSSSAQGSSYTSKGDAANSFKSEMIGNIEQEFSDFIYEVFPPAVTILAQGMDSKRGKAKTVLCRTNAKFRIGTRFDVYTEETIDLGGGEVEVIQNKIGELKLTDKKGGGKVIECKVVNGKSKIHKMNKEKILLKCRPNFKTSVLDGLIKF